MFKKFLFVWAICLSLACQNQEQPISIQIDFNADSSAIVFLNIQKSSLKMIKTLLDSGKNEAEQMNLVSVLQLNSAPSEALAEEVFPGKIAIVENVLTFIPDQPFVKGKEYLVETYIESTFGDFKSIASANLGHKPQVKTFSIIR